MDFIIIIKRFIDSRYPKCAVPKKKKRKSLTTKAALQKKKLGTMRDGHKKGIRTGVSLINFSEGITSLIPTYNNVLHFLPHAVMLLNTRH